MSPGCGVERRRDERRRAVGLIDPLAGRHRPHEEAEREAGVVVDDAALGVRRVERLLELPHRRVEEELVVLHLDELRAAPEREARGVLPLALFDLPALVHDGEDGLAVRAAVALCAPVVGVVGVHEGDFGGLFDRLAVRALPAAEPHHARLPLAVGVLDERGGVGEDDFEEDVAERLGGARHVEVRLLTDRPAVGRAFCPCRDLLPVGAVAPLLHAGGRDEGAEVGRAEAAHRADGAGQRLVEVVVGGPLPQRLRLVEAGLLLWARLFGGHHGPVVPLLGRAERASDLEHVARGLRRDGVGAAAVDLGEHVLRRELLLELRLRRAPLRLRHAEGALAAAEVGLAGRADEAGASEERVGLVVEGHALGLVEPRGRLYGVRGELVGEAVEGGGHSGARSRC